MSSSRGNTLDRYHQTAQDVQRASGNRTAVTKRDLPGESPLCEHHRGQTLGEQHILQQTALLPLCEECRMHEIVSRAYDHFKPFDGCLCATQLMVSECWACKLKEMEQVKVQAVTSRTRILKPSGQRVLLCRCGSHVELADDDLEMARQCACCDGIVGMCFTNFAGESLLFERLTENVEFTFPVSADPKMSADTDDTHAAALAMTTRVMVGSISSGTHHMPAAYSPTAGYAPSTSYAPPAAYSPPTAYTSRPVRQPTIAAPAFPSLMPGQVGRMDVGNRKRKAPSRSAEVTLAMIDRDEGSSQTQTQKKKKQKIDPSTPKPAKAIRLNGHDALVACSYVKEVMNATAPTHPTLQANNDGQLITAPTAQPSYLTHPGHAIPARERKQCLRLLQQARETDKPPTYAPHSALNFLRGVEASNQVQGLSKVYNAAEYDEELVKYGADAQMRRRVRTFVERMWEGKVAAVEVGIAARIALRYGK